MESSQAASALALVEDVFEELASALGEACSDNGVPVEVLLEQRQTACYELALAASELCAAREMFAGGAGIHSRLADVFLGHALPAVLQRLDAIAAELGAGHVTGGVRGSPAYLHVMAHGTGDALSATGEAILDAGLDFTRIETGLQIDLMRESFFRFGQDQVAPIAEDIHRHDRDIPDAIITQLAAMGVFGLSVPARYGGSAPDEDGDMQAMIAVTEALSESSLGAAGSLITRPEILTRAMLAGGTEAQRQYWLPRIAAGDPLVAIAITEPDFGSDVASLALRASRTEGGWRLNGAKTWCTFAGRAGLLMVVARTGDVPGHKGLSVLLVEKPGFAGHAFDWRQPRGGRLSGRAIPTIGYRGMHSFDLAFEDFIVPDSHVLGEAEGLGKGFYHCMAGMTGGRVQTAGRACGVMAAAIKAAVRHAQDRRLFGKPLAAYPLTRARIALMAARYAACRSLAYRVGSATGADDRRIAASLVKLYACRSAEQVTRDALQLHGGMGYAEESSVSRYFVDARVLSIFEGSEETLALRVVARELLQRRADGRFALAASRPLP